MNLLSRTSLSWRRTWSPRLPINRLDASITDRGIPSESYTAGSARQRFVGRRSDRGSVPEIGAEPVEIAVHSSFANAADDARGFGTGGSGGGVRRCAPGQCYDSNQGDSAHTGSGGWLVGVEQAKVTWSAPTF